MEILRELKATLPPVAVDLIRLAIWLLLLMMIFVPLETLLRRTLRNGLPQRSADRSGVLLPQ